MPRPIYILCCQSGSEDRLTGLVSHFEVIERIEIRHGGDNASHNSRLRFRIDAFWAQDDEHDPDRIHEFNISLKFIPERKTDVDQLVAPIEITLYNAEIRFDRPRLRLMILADIPAPTGNGILLARGKTRLFDAPDSNWVVQEYPIDVVDLTGLDLESKNDASP